VAPSLSQAGKQHMINNNNSRQLMGWLVLPPAPQNATLACHMNRLHLAHGEHVSDAF
jgi:hypothetical protein